MKTMRLENNSQGEFLIRCEAQRYSVAVDTEHEIYDTSPPKLLYSKFKILRRTPKGAWIVRIFGDQKFVLLSARKQFASETKEEALDQFRHRKLSQVRTLSARLRCAKEDLELAKRTQAAAARELTLEDLEEIGHQQSEIWEDSNKDRGI